jgi:CubicO group peptidase (beta-lactamase class C family)
MKKSFIILLLAFTSAVNAQNANKDAVDRIVTAFAEQHSFSGVVLVADKGKIQYEKAVGYREFAGQIPLKKTDIFELASVSKQFTAMVIMMLKERNLLQYDDPVEKYLVIPYKGITIRNLLTHTSGLPDYQEIMDAHWDKTKVAGNNDIIAYLNQYHPPVLFEPGTKYNYSNTFPSSDYTIWLGNRKGPGRISSTAEDLLKWDQALYTEKIISQQTLSEAFKSMALNDGKISNYGFGWVILNQPTGQIVWHNGDNPGYKTQIMRYLSKNRTLIVLSNNASDQFTELIKQLQPILIN